MSEMQERRRGRLQVSRFKAALLGACLSLLGGCAQYGVVKTAVAVNGAKAADEVRATAEWTLCDAISVGAWRRAYAGDPGKAQGWKALCTQPVETPAVPAGN